MGYRVKDSLIMSGSKKGGGGGGVIMRKWEILWLSKVVEERSHISVTELDWSSEKIFKYQFLTYVHIFGPERNKKISIERQNYSTECYICVREESKLRSIIIFYFFSCFPEEKNRKQSSATFSLDGAHIITSRFSTSLNFRHTYEISHIIIIYKMHDSPLLCPFLFFRVHILFLII